MYEQKISFKVDVDGMDGNSSKVVASLFYFFSYRPVAIFPLCSLVCATSGSYFFVVLVGSGLKMYCSKLEFPLIYIPL